MNYHQQKLFLLLQVNFKRQRKNHLGVFVVLPSVDMMDQKFHLCFFVARQLLKQEEKTICSYLLLYLLLAGCIPDQYSPGTVCQMQQTGSGDQNSSGNLPSIEKKQRVFIRTGVSLAPTPLSRGPKSLNFPDGNFQRAKTFRAECVNRFRDKKKRVNRFRDKWLAIAKLKPLSLFISVLLMLKKALDNVKMEK